MKRISVLDFIEKIQAVPDIDVKIDDTSFYESMQKNRLKSHSL